jgi:MoxR-like ATPase
MKKAYELSENLCKEVASVIQDKDEQIRLIIATWFAGGHVLLEDVPGTGKTILAKAIAKATNVDFARAQFTPDLLPSDLTGTMIYDAGSKKFKLLKGPVLTTLFLADEINRATPRTQSALLEAMAERQVTMDNKNFKLNDLFFTIATQNPLEQKGTFPLPEAQLDRFAVQLSLGYPNKENELELIKKRMNLDPLDRVEPILTEKEIIYIKQRIQDVKVDDSIYEYAVDIVTATRNHPEIKIGVSPRASMTLVKVARALSLIKGETYVKPSTIYYLAPYVINHRLTLTTEARYSGKLKEDILSMIMSKVKTPTI